MNEINHFKVFFIMQNDVYVTQMLMWYNLIEC
jgi:hypothetical protein